MAKLIEVYGSLGGAAVPTDPIPKTIKAGVLTSVRVGYLVKEDGGNAGYYLAGANGDSSSATIKGVACTDSLDTVAADGNVDIVSAPTLICRMKATTPGNLARSVIGTKCTLDVSSGDYTVDENDTSSGFIEILSYDNTTDGNCIVAIDCD